MAHPARQLTANIVADLVGVLRPMDGRGLCYRDLFYGPRRLSYPLVMGIVDGLGDAVVRGTTRVLRVVHISTLVATKVSHGGKIGGSGHRGCSVEFHDCLSTGCEGEGGLWPPL